MSNSTVKKLTICCGILFIILGIITIFVIKNDKNFDNFYLNIYEVDKNINSEYFLQAGERLSSLYGDVYNTKTALIFLKRSEKIAERTNDYHQFTDFSEKIYKKYNNNIEIAAVCSYALQMNREYERAFKISEEKLKKSEYRNIHLLNIIENDIIVDDLKTIENFESDYNFLFADEYKPEMLAAAAENHWDERYLIDEALLLLNDGNIKEANEILFKTEERSFPEIKMLASYDNVDYKNSEQYFQQIKSDTEALDEDLLFIGCDILMRNGKKNNASDIYEAYVIDSPDAYSLPYRNLYSINRNSASSIKWLSIGLSHFPESKELLISSAWEFYLNNNYEELNNLMSKMESSDDVIAELFRVNMMLAGRSPEHIIGNYWNIFNKDVESEIVAKSFANYLLQNRRYKQLELLLQKYLTYNDPEEWVYQYLAIGKVISGEYAKALENIDLSIDINENYINEYNKALILEISGFYDQAERYYQKSLLNADHKEINLKNHSKIYFKLAETNYNNNSFKDAYHYIRMAIDLDPDDLKNKLFLRKIKEEYYD